MAGSSPAMQRIYVGGWRSDITREDCGYKYKYIYKIDLCIYTFYRCRYIYIYTEMNMNMFLSLYINKTLKTYCKNLCSCSCFEFAYVFLCFVHSSSGVAKQELTRRSSTT